MTTEQLEPITDTLQDMLDNRWVLVTDMVAYGPFAAHEDAETFARTNLEARTVEVKFTDGEARDVDVPSVPYRILPMFTPPQGG